MLAGLASSLSKIRWFLLIILQINKIAELIEALSWLNWLFFYKICCFHPLKINLMQYSAAMFSNSKLTDGVVEVDGHLLRVRGKC